MASLIQLRRDITTNWSSVNPILAHGELGYDITLNRVKIGNGVTPWNTLAWLDFDITQSLTLLDLGIPDGANGQVLSTNGSASFQFVDMPRDVSQLTDTTGLLNFVIPPIPADVSELTDATGLLVHVSKTSQLTNDSGFLTAASVPANVSQLTNDVGYITAAGVPTDVSQLTDTSNLLADTLPAGGDGSIQISSGGAFAAAAGASYNNATAKLSLTKLQVVSVDGNLVPTTNILQDLGTPTQRWRDIYLSTNTIHLGDSEISIDVDGDLTVDGEKITSSSAIGQQLALKADVAALAPIALTGNYADLVGAPTDMATQAYVDSAVETIVGSAPAILDTLKELSDALGSDANFATTIATQIAALETADTTTLEQITALQASVDILQTSGGSADAAITGLQSAVTQTEVGIANLQSDVTALGTYTTALGSSIANLQAADITTAATIADLQAADITTAATIADLQAADITTAATIADLQAIDLQMSNEIIALQTADQLFQNDIANLQIADNAAADQITMLQTADSLLQNDITALQTTDGTLATAISDLAATDTIIQTNLAATQAQLDALATVAITGSYADLTGTPTGMATESYVDTKVADLVNSAPATLDTLNELATALGSDPNFATTVSTQIGTKADAATTYTKTEVDAAISAVNSSLATVATTGAYADLTGKPDLTVYATTVELDAAIAAIPAVDLTPYATTVALDAAIADVGSSLATVATTGSYNDLIDLPVASAPAEVASAPTATEAGSLWFNIDDGRMYVYDGGQWIDSSPIPSSEIYGLTDLADVTISGAVAGNILVFDGISWGAGAAAQGFSGNYNDLTNKPSIPSVAGLATQTYVDTAVAGVQGFSGDYNDLTNKPNLSLYTPTSELSNVALSGNYNDLSFTPTIPSIAGLATESYVDTAVANLVNSAPGALDTLSELAAALGNDTNFATTIANQLATIEGSITSLQGSSFSGSYVDLTNKPTIPAILTDLSIIDGTVGQVLTANGDGTFTFADAAAAPTPPVTISATPPASPAIGNLWYDEAEVRTFVWNGSAWIDAAPAGSSGTSIPDGTQVGQQLLWSGTEWVVGKLFNDTTTALTTGVSTTAHTSDITVSPKLSVNFTLTHTTGGIVEMETFDITVLTGASGTIWNVSNRMHTGTGADTIVDINIGTTPLVYIQLTSQYGDSTSCIAIQKPA